MGSGDSTATAAQRPGGAHTASRSPRVCRPHPRRACRLRYHDSRAQGLHPESAKVGAKWVIGDNKLKGYVFLILP